MGGKSGKDKTIPPAVYGEPSQGASPPRTRKNAAKLNPLHAVAATRIGSGERASDVARDMGLDDAVLSRLKWGTDPVSREYQRLMKAANDQAIALAGTAALRRLLAILEGGGDRDAAAAAREVENMRRNLNSLRTDLEKLAIERDRLDIQRQQADAISKAADQGPTGLVFLPQKLDHPGG